MTSSYDEKSLRTREETDEYSDPVQQNIQYKTTYQIIEEHGLSINFEDGRVWLSA